MLLVHDGQWNRNPAQLGFPSNFVKILTVEKSQSCRRHVHLYHDLTARREHLQELQQRITEEKAHRLRAYHPLGLLVIHNIHDFSTCKLGSIQLPKIAIVKQLAPGRCQRVNLECGQR